MKEIIDSVIHGDCLAVLHSFPSDFADLVYLDPPFFTQQDQKQTTRDGSKEYQFVDKWSSKTEYIAYMRDRLDEIKRVLKPTGSVFFHCDKNSSHFARSVLEELFGEANFRAEIIWYYRRWSNNTNNLLPAHQTIFFFSKTGDYKFNTIRADYSYATNVDQIWQRRVRDKRNKTVYARDVDDTVLSNGSKKGVPMCDVWDIPYLNPKARERTGYPTQKPITLLERIISLVTDPEDIVVDPFCGSGTTLVAAQLLKRHYIGIDSSEPAVNLSKNRLQNPIRSSSGVLESGRDSYNNLDEEIMRYLEGLSTVPVQRNSGIDAFLKDSSINRLIPIRVQRSTESLHDTVSALYKAAKARNCSPMIVIKTHSSNRSLFNFDIPSDVLVVDALQHSVLSALEKWKK